MASPNHSSAATITKQITIAVFNSYTKTMCESSPTLPQRREESPSRPTSDEQPSFCQLTNGTLSPTLGSPSAITPTPDTEPENLWSEQAISSSSQRRGESKKVNIVKNKKFFVCVDCRMLIYITPCTTGIPFVLQ